MKTSTPQISSSLSSHRLRTLIPQNRSKYHFPSTLITRWHLLIIGWQKPQSDPPLDFFKEVCFDLSSSPLNGPLWPVQQNLSNKTHPNPSDPNPDLCRPTHSAERFGSFWAAPYRDRDRRDQRVSRKGHPRPVCGTAGPQPVGTRQVRYLLIGFRSGSGLQGAVTKHWATCQFDQSVTISSEATLAGPPFVRSRGKKGEP